MIQNFYTLPDLVDLALKVPEIGSVNFNILHTVLQTLIAELRLHNVRPWCHIENPILAKSALTKAKLKGETIAKEFGAEESIGTERPPPQTPQPVAKQKVEETPSKSEEKIEKQTEESVLPTTDEETVSEEIEKPPQTETAKEDLPAEESTEQKTSEAPEEKEREEPKKEPPEEHPERKDETPKSRREAAGWDDVSQELKTHRKSLHVEEGSKAKTTQDLRQVKDAWRYTQLDTRVTATEEGMMREARRRPDNNLFSVKTTGGITAEDFENLEDRVEELEDARVVFDEDHLKLSDVDKTQKVMVEEFEEIKALGGEIKEMKVEIAAKADMQEMVEALALKGDLELVNTKVDQTEFETAIEELGEAIGLLGIKFQKKNEEWEERAADVWRALDGKMSRDIFDEAVLKINSRLTALLYGLKKIKKVVENLLYPDASGVTSECIDPKQMYKGPGNISDESDDKESFLRNVSDAYAKLPTHDEPPFCASPDTIISIPFSTSTYRSSPEEPFPDVRPNLRVGPINEKADHRETDKLKGRSQVPKLPQINNQETGHSSSKQRQEIEFSVPKVRAKQQHRELIFTKKMLSRFQREGKLPEMKPQPPSIQQTSPSMPPKEKKISASTDIITDSAGNLQSFAPMRLIQDPLRREIILSPPETNRQYKPTTILAPLSTGTSSYKDYSSTS
ncbi:translation initiation factor IF-2-like [Argiope bruennichi]|uniref:translation initiation factor IF-2-like n=1 Tax=Argiope bruennichi TaxID=94029 RepID=UPI002494AC85|nr:translation initiation factor IF-2-like [Argiope bruennichi]